MINANCFSNFFRVEALVDNNNLSIECIDTTRACNQFGNANCSNGTITGNATWSDASWSWDVSACKCEIDSVIEGKYCKGPQIRFANTNVPVQATSDNITYSTTPNTYYCNRCADDDSTHKYYADLTSSYSNQCSPDLTHGHVCKCESANSSHGYYRTGKCNGTTWNNSNDICRGNNKCPGGKTTTNPNPISTTGNGGDVCKYDGNTKLCDSVGCFTLSELSGLTPSNWQDL